MYIAVNIIIIDKLDRIATCVQYTYLFLKNICLYNAGLVLATGKLLTSSTHTRQSRLDNLHQHGVLPSGMDNVILKPLEFKGHVDRRLSDWCTSVPIVSVSAELEAVQVCVHMCAINRIQSTYLL